jgi:hypothetical protein
MSRPVKIVLIGVALLLFVVVARFSSYKATGEQRQLFTSPLTNSFYIFARQFVETGTFRFPLPKTDLPIEIQRGLTPRDITQYDSAIVPQAFPFQYFVFGLIAMIFGMASLPWFTILTTVLVLYGVYRLGNLLYSRRSGIIAAILVSVFPIVMLYATDFVNPNVFSWLAYVWGFYWLALFNQSKRYRDCILSLVCFTIVFLFRYDNIFILAPLFIFVLCDPRRYLRLGNIVVAFICVGVALTTVFKTNTYLYGDYLRTGYHLAQAMRVASVYGESNVGTNLINFSLSPAVLIGQMISLFRGYGFHILMILFGFVLFIRQRHTSYKQWSFLRFAWLYVIVAGFIRIYMNGSKETYGFDEFTLASSFVRYLSPIIIIGIVLASGPVTQFFKDKQKALVVLFAGGILFVSTTYITETGGLRAIVYTYTNNYPYVEFAMEVTPDDAFIITSLYDKFIFPERSTLVLAYMARPDQYISFGKYYWNFGPTSYLLADQISTLLEETSHPIYMVEFYLYSDELRLALAEKKIYVRDISDGNGNHIYQFLKI